VSQKTHTKVGQWGWFTADISFKNEYERRCVSARGGAFVMVLAAAAHSSLSLSLAVARAPEPHAAASLLLLLVVAFDRCKKEW
jgi:hypothetical protein